MHDRIAGGVKNQQSKNTQKKPPDSCDRGGSPSPGRGRAVHAASVGIRQGSQRPARTGGSDRGRGIRRAGAGNRADASAYAHRSVYAYASTYPKPDAGADASAYADAEPNAGTHPDA